MHSEDDDEMDFEFFRKTSHVDVPRKSTRSMSCYASPSSTPFVPRIQTMHANGTANIIDLIDDPKHKSSSDGRRTSKIFSGKGGEHSSKSRKLSKYLAKQRMSIAAIGTDLLGFAKGREKEDCHPCPLEHSSGHSSETDLRSSSSSLASKEAKSRRSSYDTPAGRNSVPNIAFHNTEKRNTVGESKTLYKEDFSNLADCNIYKLTGHRSSLTHTDPFDYFCKVVLLGDSGVGKTCFLMKYKDGAVLSGAYISTVGVDFRNKVINVDDSKVKLQIWDTAGQERFRSVTHAYYRDAHALLLLYDVTNKPSFDNTREWLAEVHEYAQDDVVIMLIGNKCDVPATERQIRREDGERLAREYNVAFMETSAKTGINVDLAFTAVARDLKARKSTNLLEKKFNVAEYIEKQEKTDNCGCQLT